jgi:hypothetical protein
VFPTNQSLDSSRHCRHDQCGHAERNRDNRKS